MSSRPPPPRIALVVSDVDGTLVTPSKELTERSRAAVRRLGEAGIAFALTSSRPPRGLRWLTETLSVAAPVAGFNGGVIAASDGTIIERHLVPAGVARHAAEIIEAHRAQVWVFSGDDWLLHDPDGPYTALEQRTVRFPPVVVPEFGGALESAAKIVGVSDDFALLARCEAEMKAALAGTATVARSQPYYLDVTHPAANKGAAVASLARLLAVPLAETATIGDGANDVAMFACSGLAIAMGNAEEAVKRAADRVTAPNGADGFAEAVERIILAEGEHRHDRS